MVFHENISKSSSSIVIPSSKLYVFIFDGSPYQSYIEDSSKFKEFIIKKEGISKESITEGEGYKSCVALAESIIERKVWLKNPLWGEGIVKESIYRGGGL